MGVLVTDFAKPETELSAAEWQEIRAVVDQLIDLTDCEPTLCETGYWRSVPPADRIVAPYPEKAVRECMVGHLVLTIEVDRMGMVTTTSTEFATKRAEVDEAIRCGMHKRLTAAEAERKTAAKH